MLNNTLHTYSHSGFRSSRTTCSLSMLLPVMMTLAILAMNYQTSLAQFNQGRMLVGGSASFSSMTYKETFMGSTSPNSTTNRFSITPKVGYFVINNLAVGLDASFSTENESTVTTTFMAGPFVRYYVKPGLFFQGEYLLGSGKEDNTESSISSWSAGIGYAIFLNDHIAIEPTVAYTSNVTKYKEDNEKDIVTGLAVAIGFQIYLGKRE